MSHPENDIEQIFKAYGQWAKSKEIPVKDSGIIQVRPDNLKNEPAIPGTFIFQSLVLAIAWRLKYVFMKPACQITFLIAALLIPGYFLAFRPAGNGITVEYMSMLTKGPQSIRPVYTADNDFYMHTFIIKSADEAACQTCESEGIHLKKGKGRQMPFSLELHPAYDAQLFIAAASFKKRDGRVMYNKLLMCLSRSPDGYGHGFIQSLKKAWGDSVFVSTFRY